MLFFFWFNCPCDLRLLYLYFEGKTSYHRCPYWSMCWFRQTDKEICLFRCKFSCMVDHMFVITFFIHNFSKVLLLKLIVIKQFRRGKLMNLSMHRLAMPPIIMTHYTMNSEEPSLSWKTCCSRKRKIKLKQMLQVLLVI